MKCWNCGKEVPEGVFCNQCGMRIERTENTEKTAYYRRKKLFFSSHYDPLDKDQTGLSRIWKEALESICGKSPTSKGFIFIMDHFDEVEVVADLAYGEFIKTVEARFRVAFTELLKEVVPGAFG